MTIEKIRCPRLNQYFGGGSSFVTAEVFVRFNGDPPTEILGCDHYEEENKMCGISEEDKHCLYAVGWKPLR